MHGAFHVRHSSVQPVSQEKSSRMWDVKTDIAMVLLQQFLLVENRKRASHSCLSNSHEEVWRGSIVAGDWRIRSMYFPIAELHWRVRITLSLTLNRPLYIGVGAYDVTNPLIVRVISQVGGNWEPPNLWCTIEIPVECRTIIHFVHSVLDHPIASHIITMPSSDKSFSESILSVLSGGDVKEGLKVKKLRKMVLLSMQMDEADKAAKKAFKKSVQALEHEKRVKLNEDGQIFLKNTKKEKKDKNKKRRSSEESTGASSVKESGADSNDAEGSSHVKPAKRAKQESSQHTEDDTEQSRAQDDGTTSSKGKNTPCKGNPSGVTRLFLGNLPFAVDEAGLKDFLPGITHCKWITDKVSRLKYMLLVLHGERLCAHTSDAFRRRWRRDELGTESILHAFSAILFLFDQHCILIHSFIVICFGLCCFCRV